MYRCISAYPFYYSFILVVTLHYHFIPALAEYQPYVYSTLLFSPYYSNLLLRRRGWTGVLRRVVLGYVLPRLSFLWCYGVFCCSVPLRVVIIFRDAVYVIIIILYL
jgi:hypothetical protein